MSTSAWWLFCALSLVTAFSPGPAVLLALSNSAALGARRALVGSAGNARGVFVVSGTVLLGLGALLETSAWLFDALKVVGAAYLIHLGVRQWHSRSSVFDQAGTELPMRVRSPTRLFLQGLLVATTNPKSILFFTALLPQFMRSEAAVLPQFFALTLTFAACTLASHLCYVAMARGMRRWFANGARTRLFNRTLGAIFAALGIGLLRLRHAPA